MKKQLLTAFSALLIGLPACSDDASSGTDGDNNGGGGAMDMSASAGDGAGGGGGPDSGGTGSGGADSGDSGDSGMTGSDMGGTNPGGADMDPMMLPDTPFDINDIGQILCKNGVPCACSDGIDNDGDGVIDGFDTECTGPFDDDEGSFATGISGDNMDPKWQDCFFDGNSGAGDDGCRYRTECLTGELPMSDPDCIVSQDCIDFCQKFTPSGCDCFGCCEVRDSQGVVYNVVIGSSCSDETLDDPTRCQTCTPSTQCVNTCGECELCLGKTIEDLPASCSMTPIGEDMGTTNPGSDMGGMTGSDMGGTNPGSDMGTTNPGYTCDEGRAYCSANDDCDDGSGKSWYCGQGCCYELPG